MNSKDVTVSGRDLALSTVQIFVATEVNNENPQQNNPYPGLYPKPSKHEVWIVRFGALLKEAAGCGVEENWIPDTAALLRKIRNYLQFSLHKSSSSYVTFLEAHGNSMRSKMKHKNILHNT